jgi:shikimate kinase
MPWLVLTGYMGAGKSTVGAAVAEAGGVPFVDVDAEIETRAGMAIPEIFAKKGELWFRRTEERVVRELLASAPEGVLALGGGAVESPKTRDLLRRHPLVVWLNPSLDTAWARVQGSGRPLATDRGRFDRRAEARVASYREVADLEVDADAPLSDVVARVRAFAAEHEDRVAG